MLLLCVGLEQNPLNILCRTSHVKLQAANPNNEQQWSESTLFRASISRKDARFQTVKKPVQFRTKTTEPVWFCSGETPVRLVFSNCFYGSVWFESVFSTSSWKVNLVNLYFIVKLQVKIKRKLEKISTSNCSNINIYW